MTTITRYDPFREALSLRKAIDQLFEQSFVNPNWGTGSVQGYGVPLNVLESEEGYYQVYALLPGVKPEDIDLSVQQNSLTIKGQFHPQVEPGQKGSWLLREFGAGAFERSITFPMSIDSDHITTNFEYGVLTITVPISQAVRPKKISITANQPKQMTVEAGTH
jgi:HSP20 family protein